MGPLLAYLFFLFGFISSHCIGIEYLNVREVPKSGSCHIYSSSLFTLSLLMFFSLFFLLFSDNKPILSSMFCSIIDKHSNYTPLLVTCVPIFHESLAFQRTKHYSGALQLFRSGIRDRVSVGQSSHVTCCKTIS